MMYANSEQSNDKSKFFCEFAQYVLNSVTERIERFNKLCSILNPKWRLIHNGNALLLQGMQWKLEHLDEG